MRPRSGEVACLFKPCNRSFVPHHPAQVFCCEACRLKAVAQKRQRGQHEARQRAKQRYRASERGRAKHQEHCRAYRRRVKEQAAAGQQVAAHELTATLEPAVEPVPAQPPPETRERDTNPSFLHRPPSSSCQRPGCSNAWEPNRCTPHKKYCSPCCDNALRAASARVQRYYRARGSRGAITRYNRWDVLLAKPGSRGQLRAFESARLRF